MGPESSDELVTPDDIMIQVDFCTEADSEHVFKDGFRNAAGCTNVIYYFNNQHVSPPKKLAAEEQRRTIYIIKYAGVNTRGWPSYLEVTAGIFLYRL